MVCYLKSVFGLAAPADVYKKLVTELAIKGAIDLLNSVNTANLLAYNGFA